MSSARLGQATCCLLVPDDTAKYDGGRRRYRSVPLRRFLGLLSGHMPIVLEAVICAILMTLLGVATSYFVQHLVDSVLVRHEERLLHALGHRHGDDRRLPHAVRRIAAVPAGPRRPQGRSGADRRVSRGTCFDCR